MSHRQTRLGRQIRLHRRLRAAIVAALAVAALLMLAWAPATAQQLLDPTEPPAGALRPVAGASAAPPAASQGPQLQSVLHGSRGRELAVIDGQTIRRGEKFDGAVLFKIGKDEVVLKRGKQLQVLRLYPAEPAIVASQPPRR